MMRSLSPEQWLESEGLNALTHRIDLPRTSLEDLSHIAEEEFLELAQSSGIHPLTLKLKLRKLKDHFRMDSRITRAEFATFQDEVRKTQERRTCLYATTALPSPDGQHLLPWSHTLMEPTADPSFVGNSFSADRTTMTCRESGSYFCVVKLVNVKGSELYPVLFVEGSGVAYGYATGGYNDAVMQYVIDVPPGQSRTISVGFQEGGTSLYPSGSPVIHTFLLEKIK